MTCVNLNGGPETPQAIGYLIVPKNGISQPVVPIGRGIHDVQLLILTAELQLSKINQVGEMVIRTPYYYNRTCHTEMA